MTAPTQIALISDVHGNVTAYREVLADIARRGITTIVNLGDVAGKGPRGSLAVELTRAHCVATVRGNWDGYVINDEIRDNPAMTWWHDELSDKDRSWLRTLPNAAELMMSGRRIRLVHASATNEHTRVREEPTDAEFDAMFADTPFTRNPFRLGEHEASGPISLVAYGDIHATYLTVREARTLLNVGSVGNQLDGDASASYVIVQGVLDSREAAPFDVQFVRVPYDVEAEIAAATALDTPDLAAYSVELRTGRYRGARP